MFPADGLPDPLRLTLTMTISLTSLTFVPVRDTI